MDFMIMIGLYVCGRHRWTVTASTLINMLQTWLLAEDTPSIVVGGTLIVLCPTPLNNITRRGCIRLLTAATAQTNSAPPKNILVGFFSGLVAGIVIMAVIIILIT